MSPWAPWFTSISHSCAPVCYLSVSLPPEWQGRQIQGSPLVKSWRSVSPSSFQIAVILGKMLPPSGPALSAKGGVYCLRFLFHDVAFLDWLCSYGS